MQRAGGEPALVTTVAPSGRERLVSLDVFRGITIAGMLLVNDPGSWSHIYPPLRHADWHGWTPTDLIFPFFLFIVGITTWISLESRRARGPTTVNSSGRSSAAEPSSSSWACC
jgi:predicted acyltransferase